MDKLDVIKLFIFKTNENFELKLDSSGDELDISQLQAGDLILRGINGVNLKIYHAGIFCGQNDVIQFTCAAGSSCC